VTELAPPTDRHLVRVLRDVVDPAAAGPSAALDEIGAHHVPGEPISFTEAERAPYEPFPLGGAWGPRWGTTWFRLRGRVPEGWAGHEVALVFEVGGAGDTGFGAEALVWRDGTPRQGLSPNHREHVLTPAAAGGEAVEVYVEAAANPRPPWEAPTWPVLQPDPEGPTQFTVTRAELRRIDRVQQAFADDYRVLLGLAQATAGVDAPVAARARAALHAPADALDPDDVAGTTAAAAVHLREALDARPRSTGHRISAVGHAHLDTAWLWPLRETVRKCARSFSTAVTLMDDYPEYRFACSQAAQLAWVKDRYPDLYARIREKVSAGQFEPTGCMWVEPDVNVPSGESLVRQIVHGKRFFLDEFGIETRGAWLPDTFGFSAALPQILRAGAVDWFFTQKLSWNQENELPHHSFLWEGIDGSRVFTHFPPSNNYSGPASVPDLVESARRFKDHDRASRSLYPFGWGDGGGGPTAEMLEVLRRVADLDGVPRVVVEGPQAFFAAAAAETDDWPVWVGELYLELHRGTYTTHADVKAANRRGEELLREAELWAAVAHPTGDAYPARALEDTWKTLLLHQFHDILPGSGIRWVYEDAARDHARVLDTADRIAGDAAAELAATVDTTRLERPFVVFNSASSPRRGLVSLDVAAADAPSIAARGPDGDVSPLQVTESGEVLARVQVPALGYAAYDLTAAQRGSPAELTAEPRRLENSRLRVIFDADGLIESILDKDAGREVVADGARANRFQLLDDRPAFFDAWDIDRPAFDAVTDVVELDTVEVVERGPLRAGVRFTRRVAESRISQRVLLAADSRRIDFVTDVEWRESHRLLKVAFPVGVHSPRATYEIQFGSLERPTHGSTSWDAAKFEVCAHRWADLSDGDYGVALLSDSKYGYDVHGNVMRLSLLRAPTWPDPLADRGPHRFTYSLLPHSWDHRSGGVVEAGWDLNVRLLAVPSSAHPGPRPPHASFVTLDQDGVEVAAVKRADRSPGLVIRLAEVWGRRAPCRLVAPRPVVAAWRTDLLERDQAPLPVDDGAVALVLDPFQLVTLRVELLAAR
jgi:alpha-mannosidase